MADEEKEMKLPEIPRQARTMEVITNLLAGQMEGKMDHLTLLCILGLIDLFSILNLLNTKALQPEESKLDVQGRGADPAALLGPLFEQLQAQQSRGGDQKFNQAALLLPLLAAQMAGGNRKPNLNALLPLLKLMGGPGPQEPPQGNSGTSTQATSEKAEEKDRGGATGHL